MPKRPGAAGKALARSGSRSAAAARTGSRCGGGFIRAPQAGEKVIALPQLEGAVWHPWASERPLERAPKIRSASTLRVVAKAKGGQQL
jgi:hypothetical protein